MFQLQSCTAAPLVCFKWLRVEGIGSPTFLNIYVTIWAIFIPFSNCLAIFSLTSKVELESCLTSAGVIILQLTNHLKVLLSISNDIFQQYRNFTNQFLQYLMNFYDFLSMGLTFIGTTVLVYRTVQQLDMPKSQKLSTREKYCTKWVIFMIFLKIEYFILAIVEIIPLGTLALLVVKFLLFMPDNPISHKIYKKLQKKLQRVKMDQYQTQFGRYLSKFCKLLAISTMKIVQKIAQYVNTQDIEAVQAKIIDVIKAFEYKKAAINMRSQVPKSAINDELNESEFNSSASEDDQVIEDYKKSSKQKQDQSPRKTETGARMSKILEDLDDDEDRQTMNLNAQVMVIKPNKSTGKPAVFEDVKIKFMRDSKKITFENNKKALQTGTIKQIKWITKNMINIEIILAEGRSKVVKLVDKADVAKWVEPVCQILQKRKSKTK